MHFFDFPANFIIGAPYLHPCHGNFMHLLLRCASVCDYATPYVAFVSGPKQFEHNGHHYWFSGKEENFTDHKVDWLDGRNICREYCMDLVSLETPSENDLISKYLTDSKRILIISIRIPTVYIHRRPSLHLDFWSLV